MEYRYFRVIIACGHVGVGRTIEITRYFEAENVLQCYTAAFIMPRSKKKPDSVKLIKEITLFEYFVGKENEKDNYYLSLHKGKRKKAS